MLRSKSKAALNVEIQQLTQNTSKTRTYSWRRYVSYFRMSKMLLSFFLTFYLCSMAGTSKVKKKCNHAANESVNRCVLGDKTNSQTLSHTGEHSVTTRSTSGRMDELTKKLEETEVRLIQANQHLSEQIQLNENLQTNIDDLQTKAEVLQSELELTRAALSKTQLQLQSTELRLTRYKNRFFNCQKAIERSGGKKTILHDENRFLYNENSQVRGLLAIKSHEVLLLQALSSLHCRMLEDAHAHSMNSWNQFCGAENERLILKGRVSDLTCSVSSLEIALADSRHLNHARMSRITRANEQLEKFKRLFMKVQKFLELTKNGTYTWPIRSLVTHLLMLNCPQSSIGPAIDAFVHTFSSFLGIHIKNRRVISARLVGCIVAEAEIMTQWQLGYEISQTPSEFCTCFKHGCIGTKFFRPYFWRRRNYNQKPELRVSEFEHGSQEVLPLSGAGGGT